MAATFAFRISSRRQAGIHLRRVGNRWPSSGDRELIDYPFPIIYDTFRAIIQLGFADLDNHDIRLREVRCAFAHQLALDRTLLGDSQ
jgi:hypothetical protein